MWYVSISLVKAYLIKIWLIRSICYLVNSRHADAVFETSGTTEKQHKLYIRIVCAQGKVQVQADASIIYISMFTSYYYLQQIPEKSNVLQKSHQEPVVCKGHRVAGCLWYACVKRISVVEI